VSLPWNKRIRLQFDSQRVSASVWQGAWKKTRLAKARRTLAPDVAMKPPLSETWMAAAREALDEVLTELAASVSLKGVELWVELTDALVVLDVASGDFAGQGDRQLQAIAEACCAELLGSGQERPEVRWQLQRDERHLLICALNKEVLAWLRQAVERHDLRLTSVQPYFFRQWNENAAELKPGDSVFVVTGGVNAVIACVRNGVITTISNGPWLKSDLNSDTKVGRVEQLMAELHLEPTDSQPALLDTRVDRLLASVGQDAKGQSAFLLVGNWLKQRRAQNIEVSGTDPLANADADKGKSSQLDARVDRLLASRGHEANAQSAFVLVAKKALKGVVSRRWILLDADRSTA
jgi:hypothetical protein